MHKMIISCAITGSIHTPSMTPYLPITAQQMVDESLAAAEAGASILHLHARHPETGQPSSSARHFMAFLPPIKQRCDAVVNITTGGSAVMSLEQRLEGALTAEPEMCSVNMGSMNFALYPAAERIQNWQYDWEKPFLENSDDLVFKNTPRDIAYVMQEMGEKRGARFEFECYDLSHLYMLKHFVDRGLAKKPLFIQFVFGVLGGMGADPDNLTHMKHIADKLFGSDYQWSVLAAGRHQLPFTSMAAAMGGHVRVGLEDSIYLGRGELATSNAAQVAKIRAIAEGLGREIASAQEVRELLALKGKAGTAF